MQGYITPNWYPGRHETHRRVPTWNFEVVRAHGAIHVRDNEKFVRGDDYELHQRDQAIAEIAQSIPGCLGEEAWENTASGLISTVYYWDSHEALRQPVEHPGQHAGGKLQGLWPEGDHVTIVHVLKRGGDGDISHPLADADQRRTGHSHAIGVAGRRRPA